MTAYIFRACQYEDGSGDIVFQSLAGLKAHLLECDLDGLWYISKRNDARRAVEEWDGSEDIELMNDDYETVYLAGTIEVRA